MKALQKSLQRSLRVHLVAGTASIGLLCAGFAGWASSSQISGAVIAAGRLAIEGKAKSVQHPAGGVIAAILVQEGQEVRAGDVVVRLDETITRANLAAIEANLNQLYAREARLAAELDGTDAVAVPRVLVERLGAKAEDAVASERRLFQRRSAARQGQKDQLQKEIEQINEQVSGIEVQRQAKDDEIALIQKEIVGTRGLYEMGLVPLNRINNLDRSVARLHGERGGLISQSATAKGRIAEVELKRIDIDQTMRAEAASELRDVQNRQSEFVEREVAARDQLNRIDITSPVTGMIHDLSVHTIGGVIKPGEELMQVVPRGELSVEVRILPQDIDQLLLGQEATVRLSAFNRNTTPEITGKVIRISPDMEVDQKTGAGFYLASISISPNEEARLGDLKLVPGMPAEVFVRTGSRTVLSYLIKPIRDHAERVFRDE